VPASSPDRAARTRRFQQVNDAYYMLSEATRRRNYDEARQFHGVGAQSSTSGDNNDDNDSGFEEVPRPNMPGGFAWGAGDGGGGGAAAAGRHGRNTDDAQFGSAFEEMLHDEGMAEGEEGRPTHLFWSIVGGLSGAALGFIVANFPGAVAGAVAGNRLGAVRDAKGKSVYEVFQELPQEDKSKLLADLAAKVFAHAVGS
jgi:curved DNA-binding protein CbpA